MLELEPRALHVRGKHTTTELHPQLSHIHTFKNV
jgi:hypothetical protein